MGAGVATMYVRTEKQACAAGYILTRNTRILTTVERGLVQFLVLSSTIQAIQEQGYKYTQVYAGELVVSGI